jgi:hypothetical protein
MSDEFGKKTGTLFMLDSETDGPWLFFQLAVVLR